MRRILFAALALLGLMAPAWAQERAWIAMQLPDAMTDGAQPTMTVVLIAPRSDVWRLALVHGIAGDPAQLDPQALTDGVPLAHLTLNPADDAGDRGIAAFTLLADLPPEVEAWWTTLLTGALFQQDFSAGTARLHGVEGNLDFLPLPGAGQP